MASDVAQGVFQTAYEVITSGLGGVAIIAFWNKWIVPGSSVDDERKRADEWKALYFREVEAHQATRDAYAAASARSDAGVEAARGYAALIRALRQDEVRQLPGTKDPDGD